jgi:hypothetical protein
MWRQDDGVLSFEWTLLVVLLVIGIMSGLGAIRDAIIDEMGDYAEAVLAFDQSYSFAGFGSLPPSSYTDHIGTVTDCDRTFAELPYTPRLDAADGG